MKKICTFFGLLISMCLLLNVGFSSLSVKGAAAGNTEQTSDSNFTNLIVFARFADENEFVKDVYKRQDHPLPLHLRNQSLHLPSRRRRRYSEIPDNHF